MLFSFPPPSLSTNNHHRRCCFSLPTNLFVVFNLLFLCLLSVVNGQCGHNAEANGRRNEAATICGSSATIITSSVLVRLKRNNNFVCLAPPHSQLTHAAHRRRQKRTGFPIPEAPVVPAAVPVAPVPAFAFAPAVPAVVQANPPVIYVNQGPAFAQPFQAAPAVQPAGGQEAPINFQVETVEEGGPAQGPQQPPPAQPPPQQPPPPAPEQPTEEFQPPPPEEQPPPPPPPQPEQPPPPEQQPLPEQFVPEPQPVQQPEEEVPLPGEQPIEQQPELPPPPPTAIPPPMTASEAALLRYPLPECYTDDSNLMCCNSSLENAMKEAFQSLLGEYGQDFHRCNLQKIANRVQMTAEQQFNTPFEIVVGIRDFASRSHFWQNLICKIERDGRFILAYATPEPDEADVAAEEAAEAAEAAEQQQRAGQGEEEEYKVGGQQQQQGQYPAQQQPLKHHKDSPKEGGVGEGKYGTGAGGSASNYQSNNPTTTAQRQQQTAEGGGGVGVEDNHEASIQQRPTADGGGDGGGQQQQTGQSALDLAQPEQQQRQLREDGRRQRQSTANDQQQQQRKGTVNSAAADDDQTNHFFKIFLRRRQHRQIAQ